LTGKIGKDNNGLMFTHEHSNYQGHRDLGATPYAVQENNKLSRKNTLRGARSFPELRDLMLNGSIKGFLIFGEDFAINTEYAALLTQAEHVVVVDMFQTETTNFAHTTIPGSAYAESEGSVTSQDRRVQGFTRVFDPPAGKTGVEILSALYAQASGKPGLSIKTIRSEIAGLNPLYKRITEIGERGSFCWNETATGGGLLFSTGFLTENRKAHFIVGAQSQKPMRREVLCFSSIDKMYQINHYQLLSSTKGYNQNSAAAL
jgi:formate dehydrogenase major subunit